MFKKLSVPALILCAGFVSQGADAGSLPFDLTVGYSELESDTQGYLTEERFTLKDELGHEQPGAESKLLLDFAHPIPAVPNVRLERLEFTSSGVGEITRDFEVGGNTYTASETVASKLDLSYQQAAIYWTPSDSDAFRLKTGIAVREYEGGFYAESSSGSSEELFEEQIPMLYFGASTNITAGVELGFNGFYAEDDVDYIQDYEVTVTSWYEMPTASLGIELGYKNMEINYQSGTDLQSSTESEGVFVGVKFRFD